MATSAAISEIRGSGVVVDDLTDITVIYEPGVDVTVWRRPALPFAATFIGVDLDGDVLDARVRTRNVEDAVAEATSRLTTRAGRDSFIADVAFLAEIYRDLTGYDELGIRLTTSNEPMCPRFHVDRVTLRLLCTYLGPGTEWLSHADVDRSKLGPGANGQPDCNSGLIRPGAAIRRMNAFDVGLLKGSAWQGCEKRGAVHRSPGTSGKRLVLSIDGVT